jgi:hypothetical protein
MIEKVSGFKVGEQFFPTIVSAQLAELMSIVPRETAEVILANAEKIVDILTMKPSSLPKARKINGGRKQRKAKTEAPAAIPSTP